MKTSVPAFASVLVALFALPATLFAHEGHGLEATIRSFLHWASSPIHVTMLVAGGAVLLGITLIARRVLREMRSAARSSDVRRVEG